MKIWANFSKSFKENVRDWKILILILVFAPCFVYLMKFYFSGSNASTYNVALLNLDAKGAFSKELISEWDKSITEEHLKMLNIITVLNTTQAKEMIRDRKADLFITIPAGFSSSFQQYLSSKKGLLSPLISYGDKNNLRFMMAGSLLDYVSYSYVAMRTGIEIPLSIQYQAAGLEKRTSDFDLYLPMMLVLSIIMILFSAGASIIREVEKETIHRLTLSKLSSLEFMTAISLNQILIGVISLLLTLLAAYTVGFRTNGAISLILLTGAVASFSVVSIGIITSYFIRNMFGLLTIGCFPFFLLMFFSDCFVPLPAINLFSLLGHQVFLNDLLPTATAVRAINKVLTYGSGLKGIGFELIWMFFMSCLYFITGIVLFRKKYKY